MTTTTAAATAGVSVRTIQRWCQRGLVAAAKAAGRWVVEAASLLRKIRPERTDMAYEIEEIPGDYRSQWRVQNTEQKWDQATYGRRDLAEFHAEVASGLPSGYRITLRSHRANSMKRGRYWHVSGPEDFVRTWDEGEPLHPNSPYTNPQEILIASARQHAEGAERRAAERAERERIAEQERQRQEERARLERERGPLATPRQVDFILTLLAERERSGEGGGFYSGPTDREGIERMTRREASTYITSLKGDY